MAITVEANTLLLKSRDPEATPGALIEVDVTRAGWEFTGLTVMKLRAGELQSRPAGRHRKPSASMVGQNDGEQAKATSWPARTRARARGRRG